ncbi:MAG: ABC transporter substrate-binding protein [Actinomycetota bacterium]
MQRTRRWRTIAALLTTFTLIAAACGGDDDADTSSGSSSASKSESASAGESESASASEMAEEDESGSASEMAEEDESGSASEVADGETVTLSDMTGEITVPIVTENILALDEYAAIAMLTLGLTPSATAQFYGDFYDAGENAIIEGSGTKWIETDNLEVLAVEAPSMMLGLGHPNYEPVIEQHREIAPTIYPLFSSTWQDQTRVYGEVTGTSDRAEAVIAAVEARTEEVKAAIDDAGLTGAEVSILHVFPGEYYAYNPGTLAGTVIGSLGFTRPEFQQTEDEFGFLLFSEEELGSQTSSDIVIWMDTRFEGSIFDEPLSALRDDAIGVQLISSWTANHALGAWIMLEDVERIVTGQPPVEAGAGVAEAYGELIAAIEAQLG